MRFALAFACLPIFVSAQTRMQNVHEKLMMEYSGFRAAHSVGFFGQYFWTVETAHGATTGFGVLQEVPGKKHGLFRDSNEFEIFVDGQIFRPEETQKVFANGIMGLPRSDSWEFETISGKISTYSVSPFGPAEQAVFNGKRVNLKSHEGEQQLRAILKSVPEALELFSKDPAEAIRYYNSAPEGEFVRNLNYPDGIVNASFKEAVSTSYDLIKADRRLAFNANDLIALSLKARGLCDARRYDEANAVILAMSAIRSNYFRIPLERAECLEKQGEIQAAGDQFKMALRLAPEGSVEDLVNQIDANVSKKDFDSAATARSEKTFWLEWDALGLGMPEAVAGSSISANTDLYYFSLSITAGLGFTQFSHPSAALPALGLRIISPGGRFKLFAGYDIINPFRLGPSGSGSLFGPEAGVIHDIGNPGGFKLTYGLSYATVLYKKNPTTELRQVKSTGFIIPVGRISYAF
jgi:hypothetical protein